MQIKKIISDIFLKNKIVLDACLITVTKVNLSSDLRIAKIYISIFSQNSDNEFKNKIFTKIKHDSKNIKYLLGLKMNSKFVPDVKFFFDQEYEIYDNINKILKNG